MLDFLKRHPIPIKAFFDFSLVLAYALPEELLKPLLPPGLTLDTYQGHGFVAIAFVQTRGLRPKSFPSFMGRNFFLSGYRIFTRFRRSSGQELRGLRILRSDTDSRFMASAGNALTHYNYRYSRVELSKDPRQLSLAIQTVGHEADISLTADLSVPTVSLPSNSPFPDWRIARRFAGPLPFTFDYEEKTHSIVMIEGVRQHWTPRPVSVAIKEVTFFNQPPFEGVRPVLASAFYIEAIPYQWRRGVVEHLPRDNA